MLLVVDAGNTHTVIGIFDADRLVHHWRIHTDRHTTEDELQVLITGLFAASAMEPAQITHTILSSVVPPMGELIEAFCRKYLGHAPVQVDAATCGGLPIRYGNPDEVGADRLVNAVAAYDKYRTSLIVIDFGTATTFDAISADGAYLGGAISPGIGIASDALFSRASKLPRIELHNAPKTAIGKDTAASMQSGIVFGYAALVDGMVDRIRAELTASPKVIATGGWAALMGQVARRIEAVEPLLTLEGLRLIWNRTPH